MVRFITISQKELGAGYKKSFAFFSTVSDQFEKYDGEHIWNSWVRFETAFAMEPTDETVVVVKEALKRRYDLCPEWVFK